MMRSTRKPSDFSHTQKLGGGQPPRSSRVQGTYSFFSKRSSDPLENDTGCDPGNLWVRYMRISRAPMISLLSLQTTQASDMLVEVVPGLWVLEQHARNVGDGGVGHGATRDANERDKLWGLSGRLVMRR